MADNIPITPGSGVYVSTDEVNGAHVQLVKVAYGPDGSATMVDAASPLPVVGNGVNPSDGLTGSASVSSASVLATVACAYYRGIWVDVYGIGTGNVVVVEQQITGSGTWYRVAGVGLSTLAPTYAETITSTGAWVFPLWGTSVRVRVITYQSGTVSVRYNLKSTPFTVERVQSAALNIISAASTNATLVKSTPGVLVGIDAANMAASWRHIKVHNTSTTPTAGTGAIYAVSLAPGARTLWRPPDNGIWLSTGIGLTITAGVALTDTTSVGANDVSAQIYYI